MQYEEPIRRACSARIAAVLLGVAAVLLVPPMLAGRPKPTLQFCTLGLPTAAANGRTVAVPDRGAPGPDDPDEPCGDDGRTRATEGPAERP